jgi:pSer/pThr/pTyr-binding forkhead associated (FHA) protein
VNTSKNSPTDLTSTIHLSQLRPVPGSAHLDAVLEKLSPEEIEIVSQLSPERAMLIGVSGPSKGFRFLLKAEVARIGREVGCDISLDDVTVSRKHAELSVKNGEFILQDSKSLNGTYVNAISVDSISLKHGDQIQIGKFRFIFFTGKANS